MDPGELELRAFNSSSFLLELQESNLQHRLRVEKFERLNQERGLERVRQAAIMQRFGGIVNKHK